MARTPGIATKGYSDVIGASERTRQPLGDHPGATPLTHLRPMPLLANWKSVLFLGWSTPELYHGLPSAVRVRPLPSSVGPCGIGKKLPEKGIHLTQAARLQ